MKKTLIYLACPYSHPDPNVRLERFECANKTASQLMRDGHHIYSPISHTHPIAVAGGLPLGWDFWEPYDRAILAMCKEVRVLTLYGWEESKGVQAEIAIAKEMGIPVSYL